MKTKAILKLTGILTVVVDGVGAVMFCGERVKNQFGG
jgi:hypothetical protein